MWTVAEETPEEHHQIQTAALQRALLWCELAHRRLGSREYQNDISHVGSHATSSFLQLKSTFHQ